MLQSTIIGVLPFRGRHVLHLLVASGLTVVTPLYFSLSPVPGGSRHDASHHNIRPRIHNRADLMDRSIRSLRFCKFHSIAFHKFGGL